MPIIILPPEIVNKIAAGEVVERPASVVKELLENSLDAGARAIEVEVRHGGLQLIRVSDDGRGMEAADLRLSVERHATSKIAGYDDLFTIGSYGFRGEALASIGSVSRLTIVSRTQRAVAAGMIIVNNGRVESERETAAGTGTTVTVEELFANVPARRKFLKADLTELRRITEELMDQALANPQAAFAMIVDGRSNIKLAPSVIEQRIADVLGQELAEGLAPVDHQMKPFRIRGWASRPDRLWPRRREQHLFVNGRRVSDRIMGAAIYQAYGPSLQGKHPSYVVFLELPPGEVDVNVHPAKREVRFKEESLVFRLTRSALERALFNDHPQYQNDGGLFSAGSRTGYRQGTESRSATLSIQERQALFGMLSDTAQAPSREAPPGTGDNARPKPRCWQAHDRYILAATDGGIIVVDQHAAHERILFEELLEGRGRAQSQQLLYPATVELTAPEMLVFGQHQDVFNQLGFSVREFGARTVMIEGLPAAAGPDVDGEGLLRQMLADLSESGVAGTEPARRVAQSFACRAAIKAGQPLGQEEMDRLLERLLATAAPFLDPHGRPSVIRLTLDDLSRRFGRS